eukprot:14299299-Heterocapsa_arctica.AAC.1
MCDDANMLSGAFLLDDLWRPLVGPSSSALNAALLIVNLFLAKSKQTPAHGPRHARMILPSGRLRASMHDLPAAREDL